jgi:hypothetical protein
VIPTQFGYIPDIALEEINQLRAQQQPGSVPLSILSVNATNTTNDTLPSQARPTGRDLSVNNSTGVARSRSLASSSNSRPSVVAASTNVSNPAYQTPLFTTNKQTFLTPTRYGPTRLMPGITNNNSLPPAPSSSSTSYTNNRSLPSNVRRRHTNNHHLSSIPASSTTTTTAAVNNDQERLHYETTYRASFIKPLAP